MLRAKKLIADLVVRETRPRGDTIVEVLLSIAIVALVVSGSYALASSSLQGGVSSAERTEALKYAESQIETLKFRKQITTTANWQGYFTRETGKAVAGGAQNFCLVTNVTSDASADWLPAKNSGDPAELKSGTTNYNPKCVQPNAASPKYFINITSSPNVSNPSYQITVRWPRIGGADGQNNQSQLYYRF